MIPCDLLEAFMVQYFLEKSPGSAIVYDLTSSLVVREEIIKNGGLPRRSKVGHSFIKKEMEASNAIFGGEVSGHFYYRDNFYSDSGLITMVHLINILCANEKPLSELIKPLKRYYLSGELNYHVENKGDMLEKIAAKYINGEIDRIDGITIQFKDWWFNCRPSNTESCVRLNIEAKNEELLKKSIEEIELLLGNKKS
jgi:phosphomannomutase